jgi:hypothetical protein
MIDSVNREKEAERKEIERQTEEFIKKGGSITEEPIRKYEPEKAWNGAKK